jgi:hypothetical protein
VEEEEPWKRKSRKKRKWKEEEYDEVVGRRITLGSRKEERIRRVGRTNMIKMEQGRGVRRITCCRGRRRSNRRNRLEKGGGGRRKAH